MKKLLTLLFFITFIEAKEAKMIAKQLGLYPGTKASIQWERVFSNERRQKRYGIDKLSDSEKIALKLYLIRYAADSDRPVVPGL